MSESNSTGAEAELGRAVRNVGALFANRRQVCQKINARAAVRERTRHDLSRYKQAATSGAASRQMLQNTEDTLAAQDADLREARAEYQAIESRVGGVTPTTVNRLPFTFSFWPITSTLRFRRLPPRFRPARG